MRLHEHTIAKLVASWTVAIWMAIILLSVNAAAKSFEDAPLEIGIATADITPPIGYRMSGYFAERPSTGMHDPLCAKVIVFRQGDIRFAWVFCDILNVDRTLSEPARGLAEEKEGIPAANIFIAATHTHMGPLYAGPIREYLHADAIARLGNDPSEAIDYTQFFVARVVEAIVSASASAQPVTLETVTARQEGLSFNRRFHMKSGGEVRFNPGKMNPDILRPAGPIDPEARFLLARDAAGAPVVSLTNFALHLDTVGGTEYTADYPYYLGKTLQESLGAGLLSVFGTGTCGDINHIDVSSDRQQGGQSEAKHIGETLGNTIIAALPGLRPAKAPSLAARRALVKVPMRQYTPERVEEAKAAMPAVVGGGAPFLDIVKHHSVLSRQARGDVPFEVQVFRLAADTALVALPGEVFVELGQAIKSSSPFANTFVIELANDDPDYIPTAKAISEGSYETVNSIIESGGGEMLVDAAVGMLKELAI